MSQLTEQTDEQKRIRIAEFCGWKRELVPPSNNNPCGEFQHTWWYSPDGKHSRLPDYLNSLDAIHEAEKKLEYNQAVCFRLHLAGNSDKRDPEYLTVEAAMCHATSRQRAEALLRVIGETK